MIATARTALGKIAYRRELLGLLALLLLVQLFPRGVPLGIYANGMAFGAALALHSLGLVLVYRANRIINFAQLTLGTVSATLFAVSATYAPALRWLSPLCSGGCDGSLARNLNFWGSLVVSLAVGIGLGWLIHILVVRRFARAPRLVLTVATIFVALFLNYLALQIPNFLTTGNEKKTGLEALFKGSPPPFDLSLSFGSVSLDTRSVLTITAALLASAGLTVFLRRSVLGVAIRATASAPTRAATLGLDVGAVNSRVWMLSSGLSALAAVLAATGAGDPRGSGLSLQFLVRILAIAVVARLVSLPMAALAALVLGVFESAVFWAFSSNAPFEGSLFFIICGFLLLQHKAAGRVDVEVASAWSDSRELRPIPRELRGLPVVRSWIRGSVLTLVVVLLGAPFVLSPSQNSQAAAFMALAMVGVSLLVLTGWAGQISLGQFAFAAIGAYVTAATRLPFLLAVPVAGLAGFVVAIAVGLPALRLRGLHLAITSLAFALTVSQLLLNPRYLGDKVTGTLDRPSVFGVAFDSDRAVYYLTLVFLVVIVLATLGLRRSRTARALIAARDNERAAQSFGIDVLRARIVAFGASGLIAGVAGSLLAYQQNGVQPSTFNLEAGVNVFQNTVIGGLGTIAGPLIGALYVGLPVILSLPLSVTQATSGALGLLIILAAPGGLGRIVYDVRDALLRRLASRQRIVVPSLVADLGPGDVELTALAPNTEADGRLAYVPRRYRLTGQWALPETDGTPLVSAARSQP